MATSDANRKEATLNESTNESRRAGAYAGVVSRKEWKAAGFGVKARKVGEVKNVKSGIWHDECRKGNAQVDRENRAETIRRERRKVGIETDST